MDPVIIDLSNEFRGGYSLTVISITILVFLLGILLAARIETELRTLLLEIGASPPGDFLAFMFSGLAFAIGYFLIIVQISFFYPPLAPSSGWLFAATLLIGGYATTVMIVQKRFHKLEKIQKR